MARRIEHTKEKERLKENVYTQSYDRKRYTPNDTLDLGITN